MLLINTLKDYLKREDRNYEKDLENTFDRVRIEEYRTIAYDRI